MTEKQKFSILVGAVAGYLDGGKSELAALLGIEPTKLSKIQSGIKKIDSHIFSKMEEIAAQVLPPGFGFQGHRITDLSEIWSKETIVMAEAAAKMRGMSLEEYVKFVAREDLRPMLEDKENQTQPVIENEPLDGKEEDNQSR